MKHFYIECSVKYTDITEKEPYYGSEGYSFIIQANSKKVAEKQAELEALKRFNEELNDGGYKDLSVEIGESYQTTEDARCS